MEKLVLIDGNSLINRAFYAMPVLTTKTGEYTNAVFGFINMFFKMLADEKPTHVVVAFDVHAPTFRHEKYAEYKGTRKPMPVELRPQIPLLKEVLKLMNICTMEQAGIEADDIIGTIAKNTDILTVIITGDKDSFQLVDEQTEVHFTRRGLTDLDIYNISNFKEKTLILPRQIIDLKSLMGDSSDNIPGIAGVGEKTAKSLINEYGSLDGVYEHLDELKGKLKEKIEQGKNSAYMSYELATINTNCDIDIDLNKMKVNLPFSESVKRKFIDLEFRALSQRNELFGETTEEKIEEEQTILETVEKKVYTELNLPDTLFLAEKIYFALTDKELCFYANGIEYAVKLKLDLIDDGVDLSTALKYFNKIFESEKTLILFDKKATKKMLLNYANINLSCEVEDIALMKYLADFAGGEETLEQVIDYYNLEKSTPAYSVYKAYNLLDKKLKEQNLLNIYKNVELPLADVLFDMESAGFKVDILALTETGKKYAGVLRDLESEICEYAGETFNINSPKQLGVILFEKLKIGKGKKTKTGYSTNAEVLESLESAHPIVSLILKYRKIQKLQSTYIEGIKPLIDSKTGLVHTTFHQTVTATGRLSSKEPNLQNIPVRDDEGKELRKFFVSRHEKGVLVSADYSQIELRLLAAFSNTNSLIQAFNNGEDVHASTASKVFKVKKEEVTPLMRRNAKAVNFGIIYGISEYGLAKNIKTSAQEARAYINSYFEEFPEVKRYMNENVAFAKQTGYAKTLLGRRRYIRELLAESTSLRQFGERVAMNMPLQGSSADIIKVAMINVARRLKEENLQAILILQVHDELIVDCPETEMQVVKKILKEEMENAVSLAVKLTVEVSQGKNWFDAK